MIKGIRVSKIEEIQDKLKLLEKKVIHLEGKEKNVAVNEYYRLLHECGPKCLSDNPIYIKRS